MTAAQLEWEGEEVEVVAYDRGLHHTVRHELHWLDVIECVQYRIATTVYRCLHSMVPEYLSELFSSKTETIIKVSAPVISE